MKTFYIGLSYNSQGKIGSTVLKKYMGTGYSHCFFEYNTMRGVNDNTIFHSAISSGVSYWSNFQFEKLNTKTHLYEITVSDGVFKALRTKIHQYAGDDYAWWQNIGIVLVDICQNLGFDVKNPFRDHENCSELVFLALVELHPELADKYGQNTIRPDHIEEILEYYKYRNILEEIKEENERRK